ncbi:hypothetical protein E2562_028927 [Oryza meyeriana var. granulata]|uniref:Uncharacterized protein n=1 Tax=Oryza meyeriana var. granulata TaxID=110450 RepID=A0A6G1FDK2_9ORYZ|nr:hypothetical protein E2562_028927 [Oryza meyeriana var. granulata]
MKLKSRKETEKHEQVPNTNRALRITPMDGGGEGAGVFEAGGRGNWQGSGREGTGRQNLTRSGKTRASPERKRAVRRRQQG